MRWLLPFAVAATLAATATAAPRTVELRIVGVGHPIPTEIDTGPCPEGRWSQALLATTTTRRIGTVYGCGTRISKHTAPGYDPQWIRQTARMTYILPGGTIRTLEADVFEFDRSGHRSTATFRGTVTGATGRYAGLAGALTGGGPAVDGRANFRLRVGGG